MIPSHERKFVGGWNNHPCTVTSHKIDENKIGDRGSKSSLKFIITFFIFLGFIFLIDLNSFIMADSSFILSCFVPVLIYPNVEMNKSKVISENKGLAGIYIWTHIKSGKIYIGSAVNLSLRLSYYLKKSYLERNKNIYIYSAIRNHGYPAFYLSILEYINISNMFKEEARLLILSPEQWYLDYIFEVNKSHT